MNKRAYPTYVDVASWLFCAFISRTIIQDWTSFPLLHWSSAAFCIWTIPIFTYWLYPYAKQERTANSLFLSVGIIFSLLGLLGELNVLKHLGLVFASAGFIGWSKKQFFWLATAIAWLPASAYLLRAFSTDFVITLRFIIVTLGAIIGVWILFYDHLLGGKNYDKQTI